jgi:hypothetical protein
MSCPRDGRQSHPLFQTWRSMVRRCHDPKFRHYKNYGARGIRVCDVWRRSFWQFVTDVGQRPAGRSLDREDNNGPYSPGNVKWATREEQGRNTRFNRLLTVNGVTKTLQEWSNETGRPKSTLFNRIRRGWTGEEAVLTPVRGESVLSVCHELGLNPNTVAGRLRRGWTWEQAIAKPVQVHRRRDYVH